MRAVIISVGDELVSGACVDTNSAWLASRLTELGLRIDRHVTVGDDCDAISAEIRTALGLETQCSVSEESSVGSAQDALFVVLTGGLGPTPDDLTRQSIAAALDTKLIEDAEAVKAISAFFARRDREMPKINRVQALKPDGCELIENPLGTAPGVLWRGPGRRLFALPGVPREMRAMFDASVLPAVHTALSKNASGGERSVTETGGSTSGPRACRALLRCYGIGEGRLGQVLADLMERGRNPVVGTTVSDTIMAIRVVARGPDGAVARRLLDNDRAEIKRRLGDAIFGEGETTLQEAVGHLLLDRKVTIATAESCTGGLLGKRLTDLPGSSAYFHRGYVTYSNEAKQELLGLSENLIAEHGAVSEPVAAAMASSAKTAGRADLAVSITGIAGPGGAVMPDKPIGLVFVGFAHSGGTQVHRLLLGETLTRQEVRDRSCKAALNIVRLHLLRSVTTQTT